MLPGHVAGVSVCFWKWYVLFMMTMIHRLRYRGFAELLKGCTIIIIMYIVLIVMLQNT